MKRRKETSFMFCPSCGAGDQAANAYCKRCGDWLPEFKRRSSAFGGENTATECLHGTVHECIERCGGTLLSDRALRNLSWY